MSVTVSAIVSGVEGGVLVFLCDKLGCWEVSHSFWECCLEALEFFRLCYFVTSEDVNAFVVIHDDFCVFIAD